eukprot:TRINITY_DN88809_c2_g1_i1.p2 TRINITY_DN88809_c2_g1~~TRINITY_DN88809_c2_g1_i1.p2  ORF type:complete len:477 (-),score=30.94 TRINITY_DN88809_c2_g1_i1:799-2229(-)
MKKELDPNELGKMLSDTTTRKILIGVILMYIAYPFLTYVNDQEVFYNGLKQIFRVGSSSCREPSNPFCGANLVTPAGWNSLLKDFVDLGKSKDKTYYEVISINIPNYLNGGRVEDIHRVYNDREDGSIEHYWTEDERCSGRIVSKRDECPLRIEEMLLVTYTPEDCLNGKIKGCSDLMVYVRLSIRGRTAQIALYRFIIIIFTTVLLFCSAVSVGNDTTRIVVKPIARIISVVRKLTDNPLRRPEPPVEKTEGKDESKPESSSTLKTRVLQQVLLKIAKLLQMGYGKLGAKIVRENMLSGEGEVNIMVPGVKIQAIFLICRINRFAEVTDALQEETTVFVNKFAKLVHDCAEYWGGSANKNTGEVFLITWKLPTVEEQDSEAKKQAASDEKAELAIKALVGAIKTFAEIRRAADLKAYARHPRIRTKYFCSSQQTTVQTRQRLYTKTFNGTSYRLGYRRWHWQRPTIRCYLLVPTN